MRRYLRPVTLSIVLGVGLFFAAWQLKTSTIPLQADVLDQYFYARTNFLEPGFRARGTERQRMLHQAVNALRLVVEKFPAPQAIPTRALAEYDSGLCYRAMGETERAREAFIRVREYRRYVPPYRGMDADLDAPWMHPAGQDTLRVIVDAALHQIRQIDGR